MSALQTVCRLLLLGVLVGGCVPGLGTPENPVKIEFVPSQPGPETTAAGEALAAQLSQQTGLAFAVSVPERYIDLVLAMGERRADMGFLNTMAYLLANEEYGAQAVLAVERGDHLQRYRAMVVAHAESGIGEIGALEGKQIAYVDVHSVSGYVMPAMLLQAKGVHPSEIVNAGSHEGVIRMVYERKADAGFTFQDARTRLASEYPDVAEKVVVVATTDEVPNEPVVFRKGVPGDVREKIVTAMESMAQTEGGRAVLADLNQVTGLHRVTDADYDPIRGALEGLGKQLDEMVPGGGILKLKRMEPDEPIPPLGG
jgi:phosphonate transport system substrate-binding protein